MQRPYAKRRLMIGSALALAVAPAAAGLTGCGDARTRPHDPAAPLAPHGVQNFLYQSDGIFMQAPVDWYTATGQAPLVASSSSGDATAAIWRYPRAEPLPATPAALLAARDRLVQAARARDPRLRLIRARVTGFRGAPAIELAAVEHIAGHVRRVRSLHVFTRGEEVVLDMYAPPSIFHRVDHLVFSPLGRSLRIFAPAPAK
jgi:hypothetical protein